MTNEINPFKIQPPEHLAAKDVISLFVNVYTNYNQIKVVGHTFILGPRGIGKSMMLRYLQPDCQCEEKNCGIDNIDFLGFYISLRNANFTKITELKRLEKNADIIINEHIMSVYLIHIVFQTLSKKELYQGDISLWDVEARQCYKKICDNYILKEPINNIEDLHIYEVFEKLADQMEVFSRETSNYVKRLAFESESIPYMGPLFDYMEFVVPIIRLIKNINCFSGKDVFFLIDDAQNLTQLQTYILNYWVSTRTSGDISLKISTQYNYKSYYTITGASIDAQHDYTEIDMMNIYTSKAKKIFLERIKEIVKKRLNYAKIYVSPEVFFPEDKEQEVKIKKIEDDYKKRFDDNKGRGNQRSDDAKRYARPDYIKGLTNSYTYSYAGFNQLVHLSSGITRAFLEMAYKMYADVEENRITKSVIKFIPAEIQNKIVQAEAKRFLFNELPKYSQNNENIWFNGKTCCQDDINKLSNLINNLGSLFKEILLSDNAERRVFSFFISEEPSKEVENILRLGVQLGYFHCSTIGRKNGMIGGRTNLYILNRCLAPIWTLDPTSFGSYLSIKNSALLDALNNPNSNTIIKRYGISKNEQVEGQLLLFPIEKSEAQITIVKEDDNVQEITNK